LIFFNRKGHKDYTKDAKNISNLPHIVYRIKRIKKLNNHCFLNWSNDFFEFIEKEEMQFCEVENTIFSFKIEEKKIIVEEFLGDIYDSHFANLLFSHYPTIETVEIRSPGNETCCGQIKWRKNLENKPKTGYFAFAME
jgi:hypothetical protein